jgi:putative copper export protein
MAFLRFLMLLSLVVWLGGLIFFAFVVAPTVFSPGLLPTRHLAGEIVSRSLGALHWMGIVSGLVFLITSAIYNRLTVGTGRLLTARHLLIVLMLLLTVISQFAITPKMHSLRAQVGVIDDVPLDNALRMEFDRLHVWSEKFEEGVFLLGLATLFLTARALR